MPLLDQATRRPRHIPALDGVRGLAIVMVFVYHYGGGAQSRNPILHLIGSLIKLGWIGVPLFFVLSGFLITGIVWNSQHEAGWWKSFYLRRALRIFPLYYLSLLLVVITAFAFGDFRECLRNIWLYVFYLQNQPFAEVRINHLGTPILLLAFWSLAVEEQFYLLWPFLLRSARTLERAKALSIGVFVAALGCRIYRCLPGHDLQSAIVGTMARAGELSLGAWIALKLQGNPEEWIRFVRRAPVGAILSLSAFLGVLLYGRNADTAQRATVVFGYAFVGIFFGCLLCLAMTKGSLAERFFSVYPLRWMGAISYSLYVWHEVLKAPISQFSVFLAGSLGRNAQLGTRFVLGAILCIGISYLSYRYIESPFLRMKDRLSGSLSTVPDPEPYTVTG